MMKPCSTGKSSWKIACARNLPIPLKANTVSVSTAPEISRPSCRPSVVLTGSSALRMMNRSRIRRGARPLARAVRTKSAFCTSSTEARVMRAMIASGMVPSAMPGSTRWVSAFRAASHSPVLMPSHT